MNDDNKEILISTNMFMTLLLNYVCDEEFVNHIEFCRNIIVSIVNDVQWRKAGVRNSAFLMRNFNIPNNTLFLK